MSLAIRASLAGVCDGLEKAAAWALGVGKRENYYTTGNFAPVQEFGPQCVLSVKGDLPECLNGEFVRVGPNPKFKPISNYHWFDGDGMLHGVKIQDGKVTYVSRYVRTNKLKQEEKWGGSKFIKVGDMKGKQALMWAHIYKLRIHLGVLDISDGHSTANTALTFHDGRLLSLSENDKPYAIRVLEDGGFETIGRYDYDKKLTHPFTAHPKIDPITGEMFAFGYQLEAAPHATYRVISKDGIMGDGVPITISGPVMMHDFAITENYAIFLDCPLYYDPKGMVSKDRFLFMFHETKRARFGILPRYAKTEAEIRWFDVSTCVVFHNANAWEEGDEIVLISCRIPSIDLEVIFKVDGIRTGEGCANELWEYRFNMKTGKCVERRLGEFESDFPRINEQFIGRKNRYVYTGLMKDGVLIPGIAKYDLSKTPMLGKEKLEVGGNVAGVFWHGYLRYGSEPIYVPRNPGMDGEEDDGYLLNFVCDEHLGKFEVVVIDAKSMSQEPVAVIELPTRVPYGFHGIFISEEKLRAQRLN